MSLATPGAVSSRSGITSLEVTRSSARDCSSAAACSPCWRATSPATTPVRTSASPARIGVSCARSLRRPARMRVFAVPSRSWSASATCSCVRSSKNASASAWRCAAGSRPRALCTAERRNASQESAAGPGSGSASAPSASPSGSGSSCTRRRRPRSSFRIRRCAICSSHGRSGPRSGSKLVAPRHRARNTSCTTSSAPARSSERVAIPKTRGAWRAYSSRSAPSSPATSACISASSLRASPCGTSLPFVCSRATRLRLSGPSRVSNRPRRVGRRRRAS